MTTAAHLRQVRIEDAIAFLAAQPQHDPKKKAPTRASASGPNDHHQED